MVKSPRQSRDAGKCQGNNGACKPMRRSQGEGIDACIQNAAQVKCEEGISHVRGTIKEETGPERWNRIRIGHKLTTQGKRWSTPYQLFAAETKARRNNWHATRLEDGQTQKEKEKCKAADLILSGDTR